MAMYVNLHFINNEILSLSTSSFLFKHSKLLQSIDIDEDNNIPILCSKTYVTNKHKKFYFNNKTDLSFMFTLLPNKFLYVCKFLDIICYENNDTSYSTIFITYVMKNIKEEIQQIKYFMQPEIRSIMNFLNNEDINLQIKSCTYAFYALYLTEYKEEIIKHNRIDIYDLSPNKDEYYRYIHKYDNHLTFIVKETQEYNDYVIEISNKLTEECRKNNNINNIKKLVEQGADVFGTIALNIASNQSNNFGVIKYLVENGADVNLPDIDCNTALHFASYQKNNLEVIKYLVEQGANVNLQNIFGTIALHFASSQNNNLKVIKYLVENGADVNLPDIDCNTALHFASLLHDNEEVINYLKQFN